VTQVIVRDEMECPACKKIDSLVFMAAVRLDPCPHCGLTGEAAMDIRNIQCTSGASALRAQSVAQRILLDQTERDLEACRAILLLVRKHLDSFTPVERTTGG
jgi:hypothetical protein